MNNHFHKGNMGGIWGDGGGYGGGGGGGGGGGTFDSQIYMHK